MKKQNYGLRTCGCIGLGIATWFAPFAMSGEPTGPLVGFAAKRNWEDKSGKFKIKGSLKSADAKSIEILKDDSKVVTVPVNKLCTNDKTFIDGFLAAEKALQGISKEADESDSDNPFAGGVPADNASKPTRKDADATSKGPKVDPSRGSTGKSMDAQDTSIAEIPKRQMSVNGQKPMSIAPAREFWSVNKPRSFPEVSFEESVISSTMSKPFFAGMSLAVGGKSGTIVLNTYQQGKEIHGSKDYSKFIVANCSTGDSSEEVTLDLPWKIMAISPDGSRVAAVRVEGFDKGNDLAICSIVDGKLIPEFQFAAGGGAWDELQWVGFLPSNRLATISQKHNLTFWDLSHDRTIKALRRGSTGTSLHAELSPAGELLAYASGNAVALVDTETGKLAGCIQRDQPAGQIAFSSDGSKLAATHPYNMVVYGMSDGKPIHTFAVSDPNPATPMLWIGNNLLFGSVLYDVERGVPLWTYESQPHARQSLGNYLISAFGDDAKSQISVNRLPSEEAVRGANDIDPKTAYALVPGSSVSIQYQLGSTPNNVQQTIREGVEKKISSVGWRVDPNASNTITIKMEQGKQEEAEYFDAPGNGPFFHAPMGFGRPSGPSIKVTYQPWTHSLQITAGDKQVFNCVNVSTAPNNLRPNDGESTQAAVTRACQPNPQIFESMMIPPNILKAQFQGGLGKSKITGDGLQ
jgi:hypothetical protein